MAGLLGQYGLSPVTIKETSTFADRDIPRLRHSLHDAPMAENRISLDRLVPGVFVRLELDWHEHDFLNANFVIQNQGQIEELRRLGVTEIAYDPKRSTSRPLPAKAAAPAPAAPAGPREDPLARQTRT